MKELLITESNLAAITAATLQSGILLKELNSITEFTCIT